MTVEPIRVEGLKDFQRSLKDAKDGLQKHLRVVFNEAADLVAGEARPDIPVRSGALRRSLRATSGQVALGRGKTGLYAGWIEFGGRVGRNRSVFRRIDRDGRSIYPAMVRRRADIEAIMALGLNRLADEAGL